MTHKEMIPVLPEVSTKVPLRASGRSSSCPLTSTEGFLVCQCPPMPRGDPSDGEEEATEKRKQRKLLTHGAWHPQTEPDPSLR